MSLVFGRLICIPTRLASSCSIIRAFSSTHADVAIANNNGDVISVIEIGELVFAGLDSEATAAQHWVVDCCTQLGNNNVFVRKKWSVRNLEKNQSSR